MTTKKKPDSYSIYFTGEMNELYKNILIRDGLYYLPKENQDIFHKLNENRNLCFNANWYSEFNILEKKNNDNIILYFDGVYGNENIVSSAATIYLKDISYVDEFDEPPIEKKLKEIHLKYFCGTENYSAASYLMKKIIHIMILLEFHSIIIDTPILPAVEFYKMFGFKNFDGSSKMYLNNSYVEFTYGGRKKIKTKNKNTKKHKTKNKKHKTKNKNTKKHKTKNTKQKTKKQNNISCVNNYHKKIK
jgi:hypothetical protein